MPTPHKIRQHNYWSSLPRRIISDNGTQFISSIMQQVIYAFNTDHRFTSVYHPSANPVERKNRDLKTRLSIILRNQHDLWPEKLPSIRFVMNSTPCQSTGFSAAHLNLDRELRAALDTFHDLSLGMKTLYLKSRLISYE